MDRGELERLDRESLVARAQAAGVRRARVLTRPELVDELLRLDPTIDELELKRTRGFFGRARDLLSKVVERGLHLPDAADRLRAALVNPPSVPRPEPQAVPTVTLAEIYAAQGHKVRAIETLKRVLEAEPDHGAALALLAKLEDAGYIAPPPAMPPEGPEAEEVAVDEARESNTAVAEQPGAISAENGLSPSSLEPEVPPSYELEAPASPASDEAVTEAAPSARPAVPPSRRPRMSECVAQRNEDGYAVSWRLSERARRSTLGPFVVRAVVIVPTWDGPKTETRDVTCDPAAGELLLTVRGCPPAAVVRVAVGAYADAASGGGREAAFVPFAHSPK